MKKDTVTIGATIGHPARWPRTRAFLDREIATLYPGSFAMVMATGIISNTMYVTGHHAIADALFAVNAVLLPWLLFATLVRIARHPRALAADLTDPRLVFSFFTIVAAADVVGVALTFHRFTAVAAALWAFALALWLALIYLSFGVLAFLRSAQSPNVVHGGWLIAIVGAESLVVLGSAVAPTLGSLAPLAFVGIHMLWGIGLGLYGIFVTLFAYRIFFFDVEPEDVTPLLWVVMGATAISTNAGSALIATETGLPFLTSMRPFIDGVTLIMWAWGTWWIPLLVLMGLWKHVVRRVPIAYSPMLWSLVFPLGMYALASLKLSLASDFPPLQMVAFAMEWIALAVWTATAIGLVAAVWRRYVAFGAAQA